MDAEEEDEEEKEGEAAAAAEKKRRGERASASERAPLCLFRPPSSLFTRRGREGRVPAAAVCSVLLIWHASDRGGGGSEPVQCQWRTRDGRSMCSKAKLPSLWQRKCRLWRRRRNRRRGKGRRDRTERGEQEESKAAIIEQQLLHMHHSTERTNERDCCGTEDMNIFAASQARPGHARPRRCHLHFAWPQPRQTNALRKESPSPK